MKRAVEPRLYASFLAQIPTRFLNTEDHAPSGRPLRFGDLGRPLNHREFYKIKKWRREGVPEMTIKRRIIEAAREQEAKTNGECVDPIVGPD